MSEIATKTLAEIYLKQGDLRKAYEIYQILSERDPLDEEVRKRVNELNQALNLSPPSSRSFPHSREEKIRFLEEWLTHIQKRKRR